ncbi:hypothetical protein H8S90_04395 [Olivibacter sp. SDN3]|uniref:hypothetical protein n=1 Tax=Olivibacter sp. SDN3 TaxID=2764720 RepID=UPI0016510D76|nr:hypothetical protein [Olivibacter sp. SDN3]QNL50837.1 hypothetical protein H8S90_04395 [Olivibacter sp. SDN3]
MSKPKFLLSLFFCGILFFTEESFSQGVDTTYLPSRLLNGKVYKQDHGSLKGDPGYLFSTFSDSCEIMYDGVYFKKVPLFYDLIKQEVIYYDVDKNLPLSLNKDLISSFVIGGDKFIHVFSGEEGIEKGFYKVIFSGKEFEALVAISKSIKENSLSNEIVNEVVADSRHYVRVRGRFHKVTSERALSRLLKKDIKLDIRFKEEPEAYIKTFLSLVDHQ